VKILIIGILTSITIPEGVTTIGDRTFAGNHWDRYDRRHGLSSVTIANSVTSVGEGAFDCHWTTTDYYDGKSYTIDRWPIMVVEIGANVSLGRNAIGNGFEST
jgi:hypothetical protein